MVAFVCIRFHRLEHRRPSAGAAAKGDGRGKKPGRSRVDLGVGCDHEATTTHGFLATFASLCCLALGAMVSRTEDGS